MTAADLLPTMDLADRTDRIVLADLMEDEGRTEEAAALRADFAMMPPACDWTSHVAVLEKTEQEEIITEVSGDVIAFSPELHAAIAAMKQVGNCNLFCCGPEARNRLSNYSREAGYLTADAWRSKVVGWCLTHARKDAWLGVEALVAHRDCCRYLGMDAAAAEIDAMIPARAIALAAKARESRESAERESAERRAAEESLIPVAHSAFPGDVWTAARVAAEPGYDARVAARLLAAGSPACIVTGRCVRGSGMRRVKFGPSLPLYRKSGRNRSVKQMRVEATR